MYLKTLKLWNFRKYGSTDPVDLDAPHLSLNFTSGLNILIGENDSGKTAIIDAIKLVLKTHSYEWIKLTHEDFYQGADQLRIELLFQDFDDEEAKHFTKFLTPYIDSGVEHVEMKVMFEARLSNTKILTSDITAGGDSGGTILPSEAREFLKTTYLKPLRNAKAELVPRKGSRLSQIFAGHTAFQGDQASHHLMQVFDYFNTSVEQYFQGNAVTSAPGGATSTAVLTDTNGKALKEEIDRYIKAFFAEEKSTQINISKGSLTSVLERLLLSIVDDFNLGLGSLNRLFMASELLHLNKQDWEGLRLGLIEELEAHLHPQAQMQIIEALQKEDGIQLILTTHSPNLASKVPLEHLILCTANSAFPLGEEHTHLEPSNYYFLERFLDVTKSNLLFSKAVILVEGWSEEILLPSIARALKKQGDLEKDLTQAGTSVINVGNLQFYNYTKIFLRQDTTQPIHIPVAVVTDCDVPTYTRTSIPNTDPKQYNYNKRTDTTTLQAQTDAKTSQLTTDLQHQSVRVYVGQSWTLEYCLIQSCLRDAFLYVLKQEYPQFDLTDPETALARKLLGKSLGKSTIPYQLAKIIDEGKFTVVDPQGNDVDVPVSIDPTDPFIGYIIQALQYTCNA